MAEPPAGDDTKGNAALILIEMLMMGSAIAAVYYVVIWSIRNDRAQAIHNQTGWLRMRVPEGEGVGEAGDTGTRTGRRGRRGRTQGGSAPGEPSRNPDRPRTRRRYGR